MILLKDLNLQKFVFKTNVYTISRSNTLNHHPLLSLWQESNLRPSPYKGVALPAELQRLVVVLVGNDPTTSSMSRKCSPIELQDNLDLLTGNDPISLVYKTSASPLMLKKRLRYWLDSNQCGRFCRPAPLVFRHHSATVPFVLLDWSVTIRLSSRYQRDAFPIKLQSN